MSCCPVSGIWSVARAMNSRTSHRAMPPEVPFERLGRLAQETVRGVTTVTHCGSRCAAEGGWTASSIRMAGGCLSRKLEWA